MPKFIRLFAYVSGRSCGHQFIFVMNGRYSRPLIISEIRLWTWWARSICVCIFSDYSRQRAFVTRFTYHLLPISADVKSNNLDVLLSPKRSTLCPYISTWIFLLVTLVSLTSYHTFCSWGQQTWKSHASTSHVHHPVVAGVSTHPIIPCR